jgi:murein L,D-transpeptidase YafK
LSQLVSSRSDLCAFPIPVGQPVNKVLVLRGEHNLVLVGDSNNFIRTYAVAIGRGGGDSKERPGDHKTPEGLYVIDRHRRTSRFHRALHVSYPNHADRKRARTLGADPGSDIMIHGIQNGWGWLGSLQRAVDWTYGCIAVADPEIDEINGAVPDGTPVEIRH